MVSTIFRVAIGILLVVVAISFLMGFWLNALPTTSVTLS